MLMGELLHGPPRQAPSPDSHGWLELPELPPKQKKVKETAISSGTCNERGLRLLSDAECEKLAQTMAGHAFIGRTRELKEFPGCVRWGGGFIEFNAHANEGVGCHVGGDEAKGLPPACLCGPPK